MSSHRLKISGWSQAGQSHVMYSSAAEAAHLQKWWACSLSLRRPWPGRCKIISLPSVALSKLFTPEEERFCLLHPSVLSHWACLQSSEKAYRLAGRMEGVKMNRGPTRSAWLWALYRNGFTENMRASNKGVLPSAGKQSSFLRRSCQGPNTLIPLTSTSECVSFARQGLFSLLASGA